MLKQRTFWTDRIEEIWRDTPLITLDGIRQGGKTSLLRTLPDSEYLDCTLPSVRRLLEQPAGAFRELQGKRVVLDDFQGLGQGKQILRTAIEANDVRVVVSGSFPTLTYGQKGASPALPRSVRISLPPIITQDMADFEKPDLKHRLLSGGLPGFFLGNPMTERDFQDWLDRLWLRDIQERYRIESRQSFQKFVELLLAKSGALFEATRLAASCGISRTTAAKYLSILDAACVVRVLPPFSTRRVTELVSIPRYYATDTGLICHRRGWRELRDDDFPHLWRHFVLNEISGRLQSRKVYYWRDKRGHEVDFVMMRRWMEPVAIVCAWSAEEFDPAGLKSFRFQYPKGVSYIVSHDIDTPYSRFTGELELRFVSLQELVAELAPMPEREEGEMDNYR